MLPSSAVVDLSRLQFGLTAMYHFIFVPLTLGLSVILGLMETIYCLTQKPIWKEMTKFWGVLFGINFAMGVATGVTMEFQFGTNWAYYSQYVGDIFGAPLAIEGLMAFFLEATFVGLFFFGWNKLSKGKHLMVTWLLALGSNLSALWILIANGWMQHPTGAYFDFHTMRMEVANFADVIFNPVAQAKFVHTINAGYVTGAMFVLAVSAYYLLKRRNIEIAKRSILVAATFGLVVSVAAVALGDESGYLDGVDQPMKVAAIEAMWHTEPAPAAFNLLAMPDQKAQKNYFTVKIPYVLGLIATRTLTEPVPGISELVADNTQRIQRGMLAYGALTKLKQNPQDTVAENTLNQYADDLGYGLLLKKYTPTVIDATPTQIQQAAEDTIPNVAPVFYGFRIMVACGFFFILLFSIACYMAFKNRWDRRWFLYTALLSLPLPWVAAEMGWLVAEHGRQPWVIQDILPTYLGTSSLTTADLSLSLIGFVVFYSLLAVVELYLMVKYIRLGPEKIIGR